MKPAPPETENRPDSFDQGGVDVDWNEYRFAFAECDEVSIRVSNCGSPAEAAAKRAEFLEMIARKYAHLVS